MSRPNISYKCSNKILGTYILILCTVLLNTAAASTILSSSGGQCPFEGINGGLTVYVGENSQFQVERCSADGLTSKSRQYFSVTETPPAPFLFNSIYLRVGSTVFGAYDDFTSAGVPGTLTWTQVSEFGGSILGDGTTTTVYSGTIGLLTYTVTQTVSYILPNDFYTVQINVDIPAGNTQDVKLYSWTDIMLDGDDNGTCSRDTTFPEYVIADNSAATVYAGYRQRSVFNHWDRYFCGFYADPTFNLNYIGGVTGNLPNTVRPDNHDVGSAVQWNIGTVANTTFTADYDFVFSVNAPTLTKRYGPDDGDTDHTIAANNTTQLTFTLTNRPGQPAQGLINFTETLPANVTIVGSPAASQCNGTVSTGTSGGRDTITLTSGQMVGGTQTCQVVVDVTSAVAGVYNDPASNISATNNLKNLAQAELTVTASGTTVNCPTGTPATGSGYATSGTGAYQDDIYWLDWSCGATTQFNPGDTVNKSWTLPSGLQIDAQLTNLTSAIAPYTTGNWGGDVLDNLYSGVNPIGLRNVTDGQDPTYDISFTTTLNGTPLPSNVVVAEAEDTGGAESATWITDGDPWEPIEATGQLDVSFSNGGRTAFMSNVADNGGGILLALTEDVSTISVDMQAGGIEAFAFGVFAPFDFGDVASGYPATNGHYIRPDASGGSRPAVLTPVTSLTLATVSTAATHYLGAIQPDSETADQNTTNADGDDKNGTDDEDGVTIPTLTQGQTATVTATVTGAGGYLQAWIDFNGNSTFEAGEQIATDLQDGGGLDTDATAGVIAFDVAVPATAVTTQTYARFRWSTTAGLNATTAVSDGEVEDDKLTILPQPPFVCEGILYQGYGSNGQIASIDLSNGTFNDLPNNTGQAINALGYRLADNYVYGLLGGTSRQLLRAGADGVVIILGTVTGLPAVAFNTGDFSGDGYLHVRQAGTNTIYRIDVDALAVVSSYTLSPNVPNLADFAFNSVTGLLYGVGATDGRLYSIAPGTGTTTNIGFGGSAVDSGKPYGAAYSDNVGNVYAASNSNGQVFQFDTSTGTGTLVGQGVGSGLNDGFSCTNAQIIIPTDYADAPTSGTNYGDPSHTVFNGVYLGAGEPDAESAAQPTVDADGDDRIGTDDEDGITLPALTQGQTATITATVAGSGGRLQAWIDFDGNGTFDAGEQIATDLQDGGGLDTNAASGIIDFDVAVPISAVTTQTYARFRWSTTVGLNATETSSNGEVEDYNLTISPGGVTVSGIVYHDVNHNAQLDTSETGTGLTLFAKIMLASLPAGPALSAVPVTPASGAFTFTAIQPETYRIIIDDNATLADVTPTLPAGWIGTQIADQIRSTVVVSTAAVSNQDFGLFNGSQLTGMVFSDTGIVSGNANNGIQDGGETGLGGVTVTATDNGITTYDTAITAADGTYTLFIPSPATTVAIIETNPSITLSTGGAAGTTGGTYDRPIDTVTFTATAGTSYSGVNFADVPVNTFEPDGAQSAQPGTVVFYPHTFVAGTAGTVSFGTSSTPTPAITGWSQVLFRDSNCNGTLDSGEPQLSASASVIADESFCLLVKVFVPAGAGLGAQDHLTVIATFTYDNANPALSVPLSRQDVTTVGESAAAVIIKAVDKATALSGEILTYTLTYRNMSSEAVSNMKIDDATPAYTTFVGASCGAPLPLSVTGCAVATEPAAGAMGTVQWTFTGTLAPGASGTVQYQVQIDQ